MSKISSGIDPNKLLLEILSLKKKKKKAPFIFTQIIKTISKTFPWECHGSKIF